MYYVDVTIKKFEILLTLLCPKKKIKKKNIKLNIVQTHQIRTYEFLVTVIVKVKPFQKY